MSEPLNMTRARNIYAREREHFRRELVFILHQYDSCPITFEIKQHIRMRAMDLKPECLERYRKDTAKIHNDQLPVIGNSLRIRSMCTTELPHTSRNRKSRLEDGDRDLNDLRFCSYSDLKSSLPLNKLTYESTRRATTNSHVLSFERQLIDDMDSMIDSIDQIREQNRQEWLQPLKTDRQRQYFSSLYDDVGYSLPLFNTSDLFLSQNKNDHWKWKFAHDKDEDQKTEVERFYDQYLSSSSYLNNNKLKDNFKPKTSITSTKITSQKRDDDFDDFTTLKTTTTRTSRRYLHSTLNE